MNLDSKAKTNVVLAGSIGFFVAMVVLAIVGGIENYSPIPHWDSWQLWKQIVVDDASPWSLAWLWSQHNEHRIVITKLLFWLSYRFFSTSHAPLVVLNYIFVVASCCVFFLYVRKIGYENGRNNKAILALSMVLSGFLFSLMQWENFYWEFQSQFFLAQLMPLAAFFLLSNTINGKIDAPFILACLLGVGVVGAMANGVLALPLMFFYSICVHESKTKKAILFFLSIAVAAFYFRDYVPPGGHSHLADALKNKPIEFFDYVSMYLGAPIGYILGNKIFSLLFGILFLEVTLFLLLTSFASRKASRSNGRAGLALMFFIFYVVITAIGTAGGRLLFGVDQALSFRYTTPTIMAWSAMFVILANNLVLTQINSLKRYAIIGFCILFVVASLAFQMREEPKGPLALRKNAALALAMGVADKEYNQTALYPDGNLPIAVAAVAKTKGLLGFGDYPLKSVTAGIGQRSDPGSSGDCVGHLDLVEVVADDPRFLRMQGWIYDAAITKASPLLIRFMDENNIVRGYALTGLERNDVAKAIDKRARKTGFLGYITRDMVGVEIIAHGDKPGCRLSLGKLALATK